MMEFYKLCAWFILITSALASLANLEQDRYKNFVGLAGVTLRVAACICGMVYLYAV